MDDFKGPIYHTGEWPQGGRRLQRAARRRDRHRLVGHPVDPADRRSRPSALTVFQRTATYTVPACNAPLDAEHAPGSRPTIRHCAPRRARGRPASTSPSTSRRHSRRPPRSASASTRKPGRAAACRSSARSATCCSSKAANDTIADFARAKIRGIVKDPATAELLCPDNVFGCKRLCVDTGYFETYNLPHVKLVDVSKTPIERFTEEGIVVDGTELSARRRRLRHRLRGDDRLLRQDPDHRPRRADAGREMARPVRAPISAWPRPAFPTCSLITGPGSPSVLASMIQSIEQHVDWMVDCMAHMRDIGARTIEPDARRRGRLGRARQRGGQVSLRSTCSSWYVGANIPGRPRVFMPYIGGFPVYVQKCNEVMGAGLRGLRARRRRRASNAAPEVRLHRTLARAARHAM